MDQAGKSSWRVRASARNLGVSGALCAGCARIACLYEDMVWWRDEESRMQAVHFACHLTPGGLSNFARRGNRSILLCYTTSATLRYSRLDRMYSADRPRTAPMPTTTTVGPVERTATYGPSQPTGTTRALCAAGTVMLLAAQAVA